MSQLNNPFGEDRKLLVSRSIEMASRNFERGKATLELVAKQYGDENVYDAIAAAWAMLNPRRH